MRALQRRKFLSGAAAAAIGAIATAPAGRAASAPAEAASNNGIAIVMNSAGASISVVDMATHRLIRDEPVFREPHHWTLAPDAKELWVGDASGNALFSLDPKTGAMLGHRLMSDPYQLWVSPDTRWLSVNALRVDHVDIYDATTLKLVHRFPAHSRPSHLTYAPDSSMVYSTLQGSGDVIAVDLVHGKIAWKEKVGPAPAGIIWHNGHLLVALMNASGFVMVDPTSGKVVRFVHTGHGAHIIQPSPDGRLLYIGNRVAGTIDAVDAETLRVVARYTMDGGPDDMSFAPDGKIWISRRWRDSLAVLDPKNGHFDIVPVGRSPHGVFLSTMLASYKKEGRPALGFASV